ncbi:hypothetical protein [uncultured Tolumonas sp.]|uniref:hypothetical protein n=1 Tax=uncultured Tolumonas sp. TaxID=263765 RepID=UPI00292D8004|nr:hypothetical protein [uncultured Tolumonas sp.]
MDTLHSVYSKIVRFDEVEYDANLKLFESLALTHVEKICLLDAGTVYLYYNPCHPLSAEFFKKILFTQEIKREGSDSEDVVLMLDDEYSEDEECSDDGEYSVDEDDSPMCLGFIHYDSDEHNALLDKLSPLNTWQFELVCRSVLAFLYEPDGPNQVMSSRFTVEEVKEILSPFTRLQQIALIEYIEQAAIDFFDDILGQVYWHRVAMAFTDKRSGDGHISYKHNDLLQKYDLLDEVSRRRLSLCCSSYWLHEDTRDELFGWISIHQYKRPYILH